MKRVSNLFRLTTTSALLLTAVLALGQTPNPALPTPFLAGDSTAEDGTPETIGWGKAFPKYFDLSKIRVSNEARGGRSSRTFVTEGLWHRLLEKLKNNDYVLIQFGHNDGGEINGERIARGSLPGLGGETEEIDNRVTGQRETVRTFGWYMRKMIHETQEKGAIPILCSLTVRNIWKDGRVERGSGQYQWTRESVQSEGVAFVDVTNLGADIFEYRGAKAMKALFSATRCTRMRKGRSQCPSGDSG